jgi:hypothetical protein
VLILAQRGRTSAEVRVASHQGAVHRFLQRIERQQPDRARHGRLDGARPPVVSEQPRQGLHGQLAQPLALPEQPFLERRLVERESAQEVTAVERHGPLQRRQRPLAHRLLEHRGVHGHRGGRQRQGVGLLSQDVALDVAERLANREQRLPQAGPGRVLTDAAPQQGGERVAGMCPPGRQRQIGQHRLRLAGGQGEGRTAFEPGLKSAEEREAELRHGAGRPRR